MRINSLRQKLFDWSFNYLNDSLSVISCAYSCPISKWRLTLRFNYRKAWKFKIFDENSSFSDAIYNPTKHDNENLKTEFFGSIMILSSEAWTKIFWLSVAEIMATQNAYFACVRLAIYKERKKERKKELDGILSFTQIRNAMRST